MALRRPILEELEKSFQHRLGELGFANESAYDSCRLEDEELTMLEKRSHDLAERKTALQAKAEALAARKADLPALPAEKHDQLEFSLADLVLERKELLQEIGSLQQRLQNNEEQKILAGKTVEERDRQERAHRRWADLNELIGSADGKKFRNFAQSLTFRRLLLLANRQLSSMTDRYTLVHSRNEELALDVIDRYQGDEVRSSRSLSGGESFMVSLALALGLAQMASRNVSVDSVFLDEGFGTLDEDSLNTALDMLSSLRRKGKLIGIISHMQAIQDRVSTQIHVEPAGGGKSRLSGPGISFSKA
jgi:exonuclease SbcC